MPIRPYLGSHVFEPDLVEAMGDAFEISCHLLGLRSQTAKTVEADRLRVAHAIIAAAEGGETDAAGLIAAAWSAVAPPARGSIDDALHWRRRAEEARTAADSMSTETAKAAMQRIADNYDLLADHAEGRSRLRKPTQLEGS